MDDSYHLSSSPYSCSIVVVCCTKPNKFIAILAPNILTNRYHRPPPAPNFFLSLISIILTYHHSLSIIQDPSVGHHQRSSITLHHQSSFIIRHTKFMLFIFHHRPSSLIVGRHYRCYCHSPSLIVSWLFYPSLPPLPFMPPPLRSSLHPLPLLPRSTITHPLLRPLLPLPAGPIFEDSVEVGFSVRSDYLRFSLWQLFLRLLGELISENPCGFWADLFSAFLQTNGICNVLSLC